MKLFRFFLITVVSFFFISLGLVGCSNDSPAITDIQEQPEEPAEEATVFKPLILSRAQEETRAGAESFASDFLLAVIDEDKDATPNIMVSPFGVQVLLTILSNGMDDQALSELNVMLGSSKEALNDYYTFLTTRLPAADNQVEFALANSLWVGDDININDAFADVLRTKFNGDQFVRSLSTESTRQEINGWCSENTKGKVPEFLKEPLSPFCQMFIVNAWYFNGKWKNPFDKENTVTGVFNSSDGRKQQVEMMNGNFYTEYLRLEDGGEIVSLPYGNGTFKLNIYLPAHNQNLKSGLETHIAEIKRGNNRYDCEISMPKFSLEYSNNIIFDILSKMGLSSIADMGHLDDIFQNAFVNYIQQATAFELTENGATAAAVTGGGLMGSNFDSEPSGPVKIVIDRPFAFSITESTNGITLMSGIVRSIE